ncbi:hypothetical protein HYPSUDRAFT_591311 [Hypholoma sublateritium FD-334 SS-4]|uniref:NAD(P)-binding protein n=1 Tax=Hypholoma sublateritium (strain FD-334 SS-4) TaxID=945553 RepID=A0A0D2P3H7_HYPSF|nr:hypothetical protein HYPSUDRAFT_591311 [Hypholoma sublateritium FD-334 SS-4]
MSKVILITGSNTGIGLDLARLVAEKKHIVYIAARKETSGKEALATLHSEGLKNVKFVLLDVTKDATIETARAAIEASEGRLDVLVNNAAISLIGADQSAPSVSVDALRSTMETNFYGVVRTTTAFLPLLRKSSSPVILNVTSGLGSGTYQSSRPDNKSHYVPYSASKAALNSYTIALAAELKTEGVRVNLVTPALISTQLNNYIAGGASVRDGAQSLLPWVLIDKDGPTGKFFGPDGNEFPW